MANAAVTSKDTVLQIKLGTSAAVFVKGITSFSGLGGGTAAILDATDLDSSAKEKLIGLPDEGQVKLELNYLQNDPGQIAMNTARNTAVAATFTVTLKSKKTFTFDGFVMMFDKSMGVDKIITASSAIEITGPVVEGTAP
jgi:hypothetical protein